MDLENLLTLTTRDELRAWLLENSEHEKCCWVINTVKPKEDTLLYLDVVEEALCFGWIDSVKKKISDTQVAQRLSPRTKKSNWTELNKARARRLERLGLMHETGRKILPNISTSNFEIHPTILQLIEADPVVLENFKAFPTLYRIIRIDTIQSYEKQPELFQKRLEKFIENTRANKMYGDWNDLGRLLDDE